MIEQMGWEGYGVGFNILFSSILIFSVFFFPSLIYQLLFTLFPIKTGAFAKPYNDTENVLSYEYKGKSNCLSLLCGKLCIFECNSNYENLLTYHEIHIILNTCHLAI